HLVVALSLHVVDERHLDVRRPTVDRGPKLSETPPVLDRVCVPRSDPAPAQCARSDLSGPAAPAWSPSRRRFSDHRACPRSSTRAACAPLRATPRQPSLPPLPCAWTQCRASRCTGTPERRGT